MAEKHAEKDFDHRDTLCYVVDEDRILLIEKKRGPRPEHLEDDEVFINGPGGAIEEDETPEKCAVRETEEETGIRPENPEKIGIMKYYSDGNPERYIHIYRSESFSGKISESDEAKPVWREIDEVAYDKMWPSDSFWMPQLIEGDYFMTEIRYQNGDFKCEKSRLEELSEKTFRMEYLK